jgi:PAS domain S-box-containing protein
VSRLPKRATARARVARPPIVSPHRNGTADFGATVRAEEEVERYADLYHFAPVAYARLDQHGVIEEINQAGCRLFRKTVSEILGRPMVVMVTKESRTDFLEHMRRARHSDTVVETDLQILLRNGEAVPVRAYTRRLKVFGIRVMCWTMLTDLSERIRLEEARHDADAQCLRAEQDERLMRASSEAKDRFLAMLSHELRTPLAPALLAVNRLLGQTQDESIGRLGEIIRRNIEIEAHLINDLLDVTRIAKGRLNVTLEPTNLHALIVEAIEIVRAQAERKQIRIAMDLTARSFHILADAGRLRQVLWNLLSNAIRYSDSGRIDVRTKDEDGGGGVRITIADNGIGMDLVTLARLFRPFEAQASKAGDAKHGLGLGLSICKGIVDVHGGRIWGTSAGVGLGSTFEIDLPTIDVSENSSVPKRSDGRAAPSAPYRRVLLVEDDPDTAAMLEILLRNEGHHVSTAPNLSDALSKADAGWDIVLSDLGLPDGSGLEVARRMSSAQPRPRLIALSGYGSPEDVVRSHKAGFDEHLVKPLDFSLLRNLLKSDK